jgi:hypothetical protein
MDFHTCKSDEQLRKTLAGTRAPPEHLNRGGPTRRTRRSPDAVPRGTTRGRDARYAATVPNAFGLAESLLAGILDDRFGTFEGSSRPFESLEAAHRRRRLRSSEIH